MWTLALLLACTDAPVVAPSPILVLDERSPPEFGLKRIEGDADPVLTFGVPSGGFLYELDVHDVSGQTVIAYTPPAAEGSAGYDRSGVFLVEDGAARRIACDDAGGVWCFYPQWSADGEWIWFVVDGERSVHPVPRLSRVDLATGQVQQVHDWATEPAVSPSGDHIAWIGLDEQTGARSLELGDADGAWIRTLVAEDAVYDLGQPMFSADGTEVFVVVLSDSVTWTQWLNPIGAALAHDNHSSPGDWWSVPVDGGPLQRATTTGRIHYDGAIDPSSGDLVSVTDLGLVRVSSDGTAEDWLYWARTLRAADFLPLD